LVDPLSRDIAYLEASPRFDKQWYLRHYPDVQASGMSPVQHYVRHGAAEGRNPCKGFNTALYVKNNPNIDFSSINPFRHYIEHNGITLGLVHRCVRSINAVFLGARGHGSVAGMLSIVVPSYNAEEYIGECLESLLFQTYKNIEIVVIVDGATDRTHEIAQAYAGTDGRIRIYHQENAGLSAARNAGVAHARGEFLWFVDSDDIVPSDAASSLIESLVKSGSDFVVGLYNRFNSTKSWDSGSWIRSAHTKDRQRITLVDFPDILANAMACSKVFRRSFWDRNSLSFQAGVLYEDQAFSAEAYARAGAFDVLRKIIYNWRARDDRSSITQQTDKLFDLDARWSAAKSVLSVLGDLAPREVVVCRAVQILKNDLQWSMARLDDADEDFWQHLSRFVAMVAEFVPLARWREIPAHHAALEWLLLREEFDRARDYVARNGQYPNELVATRLDNDLVLKVPYWDDPDVAFPREVIAVVPDQVKPMVALRAGRWLRRGVLLLEGWAYLSLVDPEIVHSPATLSLVSAGTDPHVVSVALQRTFNEDIDRVSSHQLNDYRPFGFRAILDVDALNLRPSAAYTISFEFLVGPLHITTNKVQCHMWGSVGTLALSTSLRGITAKLRHERGSAKLELRRAQVAATHVQVDSGEVTIELRSDQDLRCLEFTPLDSRGKPEIEAEVIRVPVWPAGEGRYLTTLRRDLVTLMPAHHWWVRAVNSRSRGLQIDWPEADEAPIEIGPSEGGSGGALLFRTGYGNLGFMNASSRMHVELFEQVDGAIRVAGRMIGGTAPTVVTLRDHKNTVACRLVVDEYERRFEIQVPWSTRKWGKDNPLPTGRYEIVIASGSHRLALTLAGTAGSKLPLWLDNASVVGWLEIDIRTSRLWLIVQPTLAIGERGARRRREFLDEHRSGDYVLDEDAVLFRSYFGESATGNALAIHHELRSRASHMRLYWTVKDSSVSVPAGGIPVVANSRRWFELLSTAKYIVDNMHQPDFFHKRPGQVLLATFHGYPFKMAGVPFWETAQIRRRDIESYLKRQQQWDFLLSPAPYATPILAQVFPTPAQILEVGYPRNDVFFDANRTKLRNGARDALGIPPGKTVVLYAPTFRDYLSTDGFRAPIVNFMDLQRASERLGSEYVFLIRGHAFNARTKNRFEPNDELIIDVTDYPEITDLCLASDVAILDYSSLRFDYALTGNPMIFLVPDLEMYRDTRGWLVPFEETAPGPLARDTEDVVMWLQQLPQLAELFAEDRAKFIRQYMPLEDGCASKRLVDVVFKDAIFDKNASNATL
jgi:CDP-glycerol glycerophosphotransferase